MISFLRLYRAVHNVTLQEVADAIGSFKTSLHRAENNPEHLGKRLGKRLAAYVGAPLSLLQRKIDGAALLRAIIASVPK